MDAKTGIIETSINPRLDTPLARNLTSRFDTAINLFNLTPDQIKKMVGEPEQRFSGSILGEALVEFGKTDTTLAEYISVFLFFDVAKEGLKKSQDPQDQSKVKEYIDQGAQLQGTIGKFLLTHTPEESESLVNRTKEYIDDLSKITQIPKTNLEIKLNNTFFGVLSTILPATILEKLMYTTARFAPPFLDQEYDADVILGRDGSVAGVLQAKGNQKGYNKIESIPKGIYPNVAESDKVEVPIVTSGDKDLEVQFSCARLIPEVKDGVIKKLELYFLKQDPRSKNLGWVPSQVNFTELFSEVIREIKFNATQGDLGAESFMLIKDLEMNTGYAINLLDQKLSPENQQDLNQAADYLDFLNTEEQRGLTEFSAWDIKKGVEKGNKQEFMDKVINKYSEYILRLARLGILTLQSYNLGLLHNIPEMFFTETAFYDRNSPQQRLEVSQAVKKGMVFVNSLSQTPAKW